MTHRRLALVFGSRFWAPSACYHLHIPNSCGLGRSPPAPRRLPPPAARPLEARLHSGSSLDKRARRVPTALAAAALAAPAAGAAAADFGMGGAGSGAWRAPWARAPRAGETAGLMPERRRMSWVGALHRREGRPAHHLLCTTPAPHLSTAPAPRPGPASAGAPPAPPVTLTLQQAMTLRWARADVNSLALVALIELAIFAAGLAHGTLSALGVAGTAVVLGLNAASLALAARHARAYAARWRLPLMTATRAANMLLWPAAVDLLSVMTGRPLPASAAAAAAAAAAPVTGGWLAAAAYYARAAALFVIPVAGVHACQLTALYFQLPPVAHAAVQAASVAALMRRAPTGEPPHRPARRPTLPVSACPRLPGSPACCLAGLLPLPGPPAPRQPRGPSQAASACSIPPPCGTAACAQFVSMHPTHARLAEAAHWVARHLAALACPGTWPTLEAAAEVAGPVEKCTAVAWTLEVRAGAGQEAVR